jgi:hypothetical protein
MTFDNVRWSHKFGQHGNNDVPWPLPVCHVNNLVVSKLKSTLSQLENSIREQNGHLEMGLKTTIYLTLSWIMILHRLQYGQLVSISEIRNNKWSTHNFTVDCCIQAFTVPLMSLLFKIELTHHFCVLGVRTWTEFKSLSDEGVLWTQNCSGVNCWEL